jgi:hypothetical protein
VNAAAYGDDPVNWAATAGVPPLLLTQPQSQTFRQGSNVTFAVTASGTPPLRYQWYFEGSALANRTNASLLITNIQPVNGGNYFVVVSNFASAVTSVVATLTVGVPPAFVLQPVGQTALVGGSVSFTASATGSLPLSFRWRKNPGGITLTNLILNQTNSTFTLTNVQLAFNPSFPNAQTNGAIITVVVTNVFGATALSANAPLTVLAPPVILVQPTNQAATLGGSTAFTVVAGGTGPLVYQWRFNTTNILATFTNGLSPSTNSLLLSNLTVAAAGAYTVVVSITNNFASVTSLVATLSFSSEDSDGDGIPDQWEIDHGLIVGVNDAAADPDGDGMSNLNEYLSGTDPQNPDSVLRVALLDGGGGGAMVGFTAMPGFPYTVQYCTNVDTGVWLSLTNLPARPGTNVTQVFDPDAGSSGRRFYRIRTP